MKYKTCILNEKKICDNCGECDMCDIEPEKICNNCGKCLETEEICDLKAIEITEIIDDEQNNEEESVAENFENFDNDNDNDDYQDFEVELIDDVEGLRNLLENNEYTEKYTFEEFPGLIRFKKQ